MVRKSGRASAQRRARKRTPKAPFLFLNLAGETRNAIYRALLDDLTAPSKTFNACSEQLPAYENMATYSALLRVAHLVGFEARSIFEKEYAAGFVVYFKDLRTLWECASSTAFTGLRNAGARYVLRAPVGRECGLGISAVQAIVGHRNTVSQLHLPYEAWTILVEILECGLPDGEDKTWTFDNDAKIEVKMSYDEIFCTVHLPLRRQVPTHPKLTFFSHLTLGEDDGHTTSTIEGKIRDLVLASDWHTLMDADGLERCMDKWAAALCHGRRIRWAFDHPGLAADFAEMYEREGLAD